jgi:Co/Zn/Cd efflux system component
MDDCCDLESEALNRGQRKTLTYVLILNAAMFFAVLGAAFFAKSSSLLSGAIDNLGDAFTYGLSLYAVSKGPRHKAGVSLVKGLLILFAALSVSAHILYKLRHPEIPVVEVMGLMTIVGLIANAACLTLLRKHRREDINMASVWECSRNDVIENAAVLVAALAVWVSKSQWPDLLVAAVLIVLLFRSAGRIIANSFAALKTAN